MLTAFTRDSAISAVHVEPLDLVLVYVVHWFTAMARVLLTQIVAMGHADVIQALSLQQRQLSQVSWAMAHIASESSLDVLMPLL